MHKGLLRRLLQVGAADGTMSPRIDLSCACPGARWRRHTRLRDGVQFRGSDVCFGWSYWLSAWSVFTSSLAGRLLTPLHRRHSPNLLPPLFRATARIVCLSAPKQLL